MTLTIPAPDRVPLRIQLLYGVGAVAYGIKDNGFATFLLLFYNQVVGLPASTVGAVIAVALIFDAFIDPMLGVLSDRTKSRIGRRHPWLYASALPIAVSWYLLWHPPIGRDGPALIWLFVTAVATRAAIATNEVPSLAMAPELTRDYHERTGVMRYRYLFGWIGGLSFLMLAFGYFLAPPRGAQTGPLGVVGYGAFGTWSAIVMAVCVLVSALGTQRFAIERAPPPVGPQSFAELRQALRQTLSNPAFLILMASGILLYSAQGVSFAMSNYLLGFVFLLTPVQFLIYSLALFVGVVIAFVAVTPFSQRLGKVRSAVILTAVAGSFLVLPYVLRLLGLYPSPGSPAFLPTFFANCIVTTALGVGAFVIASSMMSDVVEASEETTGRREEGLFFAGALFMQKCSGGIGIFVTGLILQAAAFPAKATPGTVPVATLDRLTLIFCLVYLALTIASALIIARFPFGRAEHDARLARLAVAAGGKG